MHNGSVLIVDDEAQIRKLLTITLESNNFYVEEAETAKAGLASVSNRPPDLVLLDLGLPDQSGHEVLAHLRGWYSNPIIILSVLNGEEDIVKALNAGANDFLMKPFRTADLLARVRSNIRKSQTEACIAMMVFNDLSIDFVSRTVMKNNDLVKLTTTEYALLSLLAHHEGNVLTYQFFLNSIWGAHDKNDLQYLRFFIGTLRQKIENDPNRPTHILTESGVGYRFASHNPPEENKI